jgi:hypothetical protein
LRRPCIVSFPTCRSSPAPSHFGKSSAHLGFPCLHPRKAQMKVLVAQPHHVSESSHSPCQRNNYAIKYHLFLFSSMIVCTCAVSRGLSPPGIRAFLFTPLPTVRNAPLTPPVATLRCYLATEEGAYASHGSGYHPIGAQRSDTTFPTVRRDGCAGNSPFRRQKGDHQVNDGVGQRPCELHARRWVNGSTYRAVFLIFEQKRRGFRRPYVKRQAVSRCGEGQV